MRETRLFSLSFLILVAVLSAASSTAQNDDPALGHPNQPSEDLYMAGVALQTTTTVAGDLIVAGAILNLGKPVNGDVMAAAGIINVTARVGDDIRAAGASVKIDADVGGDAVIAAGSITIDANTNVGGRAWLAGNSVTVAGRVGRGLRVSGSEVEITGAIDGNVEVTGDYITVAPGAVIKGDLSYSAPREAKVHEGAVIEGTVNRQEFALGDISTWKAEVISRLKFYLGLSIAAIVMFLLVPRSGASVIERLQQGPLKSLGLGFVVLVTTPVAALILLFSGFGTLLALAALAMFGFTLIAGLLIGVGWIGDSGFRLAGKNPDHSSWTRAGSIFGAAVALMLVKLIPYVGGLSFFIVMLMGIGALSLYASRFLEAQRAQ